MIEEDETAVVYQYNAACGIWFYPAALLLLVAVSFDIGWPTRVSAAPLAPCMLVVHVPALVDARRIRAAMGGGGVQISGRRYSFSNPLRIRVRKEAP
ncbi:MAG: hypothetical protein OEW35_03850 [Gammaproteobacteria bacterium]|nr:hypothetical protein [Gammaproteobacteria bacterium]MDH4253490.1 hypothetical protein [Gammaproteobacteria bacterium]MDH5309723.1 hypothetical protein [Gammaproteobacteria bacterium]